MLELMTEILIYLGLAALLGLILGFLIWGWGSGSRIASARAAGAADARTSLDGDAGVRDRLATAEQDRDRLEAEIDRLTDAVSERDARLAQAARDQGAADAPEPGADTEAEIEALQAQLADRTEETARLEAEVQRLTDDVEAQTAKLSDAEAGDAGLRAQLEACSADRTRLEAELDRVTAELADCTAKLDAAPVPEPEPELEQEPEPEADPELEPDPEQDDTPPPAPKSLLTERPDEVDDLKRIKGVGPVMEGVLNDKGIYLFRQVANLTGREIDWVNDAIDAFQGRIERDNWVGQAQDLYREKYGKSHTDPE